MSELAFNVNGEPFEVPATASGWRVRRLKAKGAPEVVYGRDGLPLVLPIDADLDDLRAESGTPGRYRLDPIDETHKPIANGSAGYVFLHAAVRPTETTVPASTITVTSDSVVIEAMRMNSEIAKSVVDKFPQMLEAAATLLRAADGAGMPSRAGRIEVTEVDEAEDDTAEPTPPGTDLLTTLATQLAPVLFQALSNKKSMTLDGVLDWRKAAPPKELTEAPKPAAATPVAALPALDAKTMAHVIAIQAALTPKEVAYVQEVARELPAAELRAWFDKLGKQSVSEAVETIRGLIAGDGKIGGTP